MLAAMDVSLIGLSSCPTFYFLVMIQPSGLDVAPLEEIPQALEVAPLDKPPQGLAHLDEATEIIEGVPFENGGSGQMMGMMMGRKLLRTSVP